MPNGAPIEGTVSVLLKKNYVPMGDFTVVGHNRPAVKRKNAAGQEVIVEPEAFVPDEMMPPPYPGIKFEGKVWAGTIIRLPKDEAKGLRSRGVAEYELD